MMLLILFIALIPGSGLLSCLAWRLTRGWPTIARLIPSTLPIAFILTPSVVGGGNFAFFAPVLFVLLDGGTYSSPTEFYRWVIVPVVVVWTIVFVLASMVAAVRYVVRGRNIKPAA